LRIGVRKEEGVSRWCLHSDFKRFTDDRVKRNRNIRKEFMFLLPLFREESVHLGVSPESAALRFPRARAAPLACRRLREDGARAAVARSDAPPHVAPPLVSARRRFARARGALSLIKKDNFYSSTVSQSLKCCFNVARLCF